VLDEIHRRLAFLADQIEGDRPALATALRHHAAGFPPARLAPRVRAPARPLSPRAACAGLPRLLYAALDGGAIDGRSFDRLMLRQRRVAGLLARRPLARWRRAC
jgi:hypothetical protein